MPTLVSAGWYSVGMSSDTEPTFKVYGSVSPCLPGSFCVGGQTIVCHQNTFNDIALRSSCDSCSRAYYTDANSTTCHQCSGIMGNGAATICDTCVPGKYWHDTLLTCEYCIAGTASTKVGAHECESCEAGYSCSLGSNSTRAIPCSPGSYSLHAAEVCTLCPLGRMTSVSASTSCSFCQRGQYAVAIGSMECSNCSVGMFNNKEESGSCQSCDAGKYADTPGATTCRSCETQYYAPANNADRCIQCYAPAKVNNGRTSCSFLACNITGTSTP
jgi:hypothetical protein